MTIKIKWLTTKQAADLAIKLAALPAIGSIEKLADMLKISHATIYRWISGETKEPDPRITTALKELALSMGVAV